MRIEKTGTKGDEVTTFTVLDVEAEDLETGDRMKQFVTKFGKALGITHAELIALPGDVARRYGGDGDG